MRRALSLFAVHLWAGCLCGLLFLTGCESTRTMKVDNPVVGPPPPRIHPQTEIVSSQETDGKAKSDSPIKTVSLSQEVPEVADGTVVATVNGMPIFAGDLLEQYRAKLLEHGPQMKADEYNKLRAALVIRHLPQAIERKLLVHGLRSGLKEPQIKALEGHLNQLFAEETSKLMGELGVTTVTELELELTKRGQVLENMKQAFFDQRMAQEFLIIKGRPKDDPSREQMLAYYNAHLEEYAFPSKVNWQQIFVSDSKQGGREAADRRLDQAISELLAGASFEDVAKKYSDGPTAASGGNWDWTQIGSLADKDVEKALFELPVGELSPVIRGKNSTQVVKIVDRVQEGHTPFAELQSKIKDILRQEQYRTQIQEAIAELRETAVIETIFDEIDAAYRKEKPAGQPTREAVVPQ